MTYEVHGEPVPFPFAAHGMASTYKNGCRCEPCRSAGAIANADYRARNRVQSIYLEGQLVGHVVEVAK